MCECVCASFIVRQLQLIRARGGEPLCYVRIAMHCTRSVALILSVPLGMPRVRASVVVGVACLVLRRPDEPKRPDRAVFGTRAGTSPVAEDECETEGAAE